MKQERSLRSMHRNRLWLGFSLCVFLPSCCGAPPAETLPPICLTPPSGEVVCIENGSWWGCMESGSNGQMVCGPVVIEPGKE
jgi:hypothetical protein